MVGMRETDGSRRRQGVRSGEWCLERIADVLAPAGQLRRAVVELAAEDPAALSDEELLELAGELEGSQRRLDAVRMRVHAALEVRGATVAASGHTTAVWLGAEHGMAGSEARRRVRVANKVCRHLPLVAGAMGRGEVWS